MGKDFRKELETMPETYSAARKENTEIIEKYLAAVGDSSVLLIGSGGSYSAARAVEYMLRRAGWFCKAITPIELPEYETQLPRLSVILFTAGGKNTDSRNAYQYLCETEAKNILTVCMSKDAPIQREQKEDLHSLYFDFELPRKRDGYIAVNSTIAVITLLSKALFSLTKEACFSLPEEIPVIETPYEESELNNLLLKETLIVLYGGISTSVGTDLESKFGEVALGNVQLIDFRNFAHGRHYWLSKRGDRTGIMVLAGADERGIAEKTLSLLPEGVPALKLFTPGSSVGDMLSLYYEMFHVVLAAGDLNGVNPGNPKVSEFGRKLYHLSTNPCSAKKFRKRKTSPIEAAVYRKCQRGRENEALYRQSAQRFMELIVKSEFQAIVFDYDGTLHNKESQTKSAENRVITSMNRLLAAGIPIGIATGRGKSVRKELQKSLTRDYWNQVVIGYYNGGCIANLSDDSMPDNEKVVHDALTRVCEQLRRMMGTRIDGCSIELRPTQLSVFFHDARDFSTHLALCRDMVSREDGLKLLISSHSVDVIPKNISKRNILEGLRQVRADIISERVLFIGDCGQCGGNDFEMLEEACSLSVDGVSPALDSCWNFARPGERNVNATADYLDGICIDEERKTFKLTIC